MSRASPPEFVDAQHFTRRRLGETKALGLQAFQYQEFVFQISEGVFSPIQFPSTTIFTQMLEPIFRAKTFLEIGAGAGVTSIVAARRGSSRVVALDVSRAATQNLAMNVRAHDVADRVSVVQGDMFNPISHNAKFDLVYWNSNFVFIGPEYKYADELERAFFDPGYLAHERYLREAPFFLAPGGKALLGFSSLGNMELLHDLCAVAGSTPEALEVVSSEEPGKPTYTLLEIKYGPS